MRFKGFFTASVTPFCDSGKVDEEGLRLLLRRQIEAGVAGVVLIGTVGEAPTLSDEEEERILRIGREELLGKALFIAGAGSPSTAEAVRKTVRAQQAGADAAMIVSPYYNRPTQQGLFLHYRSIAEASDLPLVVYNNPARTARNVELETLLRIAALPSVCAFKEASGDLEQVASLVAALKSLRPDCAVLCGDDTLALPHLALGGHGLISTVANAVPHEIRQLVWAGLDQDFATARELHYRLLPLFRAAFIETNPMPLKQMLRMLGLPSGACRLPLCELREENREKVRLALQSWESSACPIL